MDNAGLKAAQIIEKCKSPEEIVDELTNQVDIFCYLIAMSASMSGGGIKHIKRVFSEAQQMSIDVYKDFAEHQQQSAGKMH